MAFGRSSDPERVAALKRLRREILERRRAAQAADPAWVAAQQARKQAQKERRHAAYLAAKARRQEQARKPDPGQPGDDGRGRAWRELSGTGAPLVGGEAHGLAEAGDADAPVRRSNVLPFRRPR